MRRFFFPAVVSALLLLPSLPLFSCTSVIISGRVKADGRPVMLKHRDTGELNNRIERFKGEKYDFIALVNYAWRTEPMAPLPPGVGEAWSGVNAAGFCIMNTATYDLKDDAVPDDKMDREGILMYRALEICRNLADFEMFLDTLTRPMGVEANFGVIDAEGGAAYYETNNHAWVKFDVNAIPAGYRVVTNFTETGRVEDRKGVDRYQVASSIFAALSQEELSQVDHKFLFNKISRSGKPILRDISSASIVFEGVPAGGNPLHTVMWTLPGWAETTVYVPLMVMDSDYLPFYVKGDEETSRAPMCDNALKIKPQNLSEICRKTEEFVDTQFEMLYRGWVDGSLSSPYFLRGYGILLDNYYNVYTNNFAQYL